MPADVERPVRSLPEVAPDSATSACKARHRLLAAGRR